MKYWHCWISGERIKLPAGKVVCIGRNYAEHARELNNPTPDDPVLFIKPSTALCNAKSPIQLPKGQGAVHHELEIALLIHKPLKQSDENQALAGIKAIGLGLDLTLRDKQSQLKRKGLPWEMAKAFDNSCPLSGFIAREHVGGLSEMSIALTINGDVRQQGSSADMLTSISGLLCYISRHFTLLPGDVVLTGTPAGVGPLHKGDKLKLSLNNHFSLETSCI